jgi:type IV pilus assembly protein PilB
MTIEDPVEYQTAAISQIEVNFTSGLTFARGLRTILRWLTTLHRHNAAASIA